MCFGVIASNKAWARLRVLPPKRLSATTVVKSKAMLDNMAQYFLAGDEAESNRCGA